MHLMDYFRSWFLRISTILCAETLKNIDSQLLSEHTEGTDTVNPYEKEIQDLKYSLCVSKDAEKFAKAKATDDALSVLLSVLSKSTEDLASTELRFAVIPAEADESEFVFDDEPGEAAAEAALQSASGKWDVVTGYCQLGGCEFTTSFEDRRSALIYAATMTLLGQRPSTNTACNRCYAEYIRDCI